MTQKTGRNEPCPCGSGRKYKRCCQALDDAAERLRARQTDAVPGIDVFDDLGVIDDEEDDAIDVELARLFDSDEEGFSIDVADITRVCYTRGRVERMSDYRRGVNLRVTEWEAPNVPQAVLDSIAREELDALEGEWGDPKSGTPIQVDVIDIETADDIVSIEIFNRAMCMVTEPGEEVRRIHRACAVFEAPDAGAAGASSLP